LLSFLFENRNKSEALLSNLIGEVPQHKGQQVRVFLFVCALAKVKNAMLALALLSMSSQLEFCHKCTWKLINNSFSMNKGGKTNKRKRGSGLLELICGVETALPFAFAWIRTRWEVLSVKYPQHMNKTSSCQKRIWTYCKCMIGGTGCAQNVLVFTLHQGHLETLLKHDILGKLRGGQAAVP
jgi:hypothetical protein